MMSFYQSELERIKKSCFSNDRQLDAVIRSKKHIDLNFEKELRLEQLAELAFASKFHLIRLFRKYYGISPKQYQTEKRLERSREYLRKGMSVSESCYAVGFECPSSFSNLFKIRTGLRPGEFQKRAIFTI